MRLKLTIVDKKKHYVPCPFRKWTITYSYPFLYLCKQCFLGVFFLSHSRFYHVHKLVRQVTRGFLVFQHGRSNNPTKPSFYMCIINFNCLSDPKQSHLISSYLVPMFSLLRFHDILSIREPHHSNKDWSVFLFSFTLTPDFFWNF